MAEMRVESLRSEIVRVDRIASKRMTLGEFRQGTRAIDTGTRSPSATIWAVAVSGDLRQSSAAPTPPRTWGVYLLDATDGNIFASQLSSDGSWPTYFDALPDH